MTTRTTTCPTRVGRSFAGARSAGALILAALLGLPLAGRAPAGEPAGAEAITVYLLRHAEKVDESDASGLTEVGQERARALAEMLATETVGAVVSSQFPRTRLTVSPLAERVGREVEEIDAHDYDGVVARVGKLAAGQAAVVCGHSNTVPEILARLGVASPPSEKEVTYGDLYVVRLAGGRAESFERRRYGDP